MATSSSRTTPSHPTRPAPAVVWIALQRKFALRPEAVAEPLRHGSDPAALLRGTPGARDRADRSRLQGLRASLLTLPDPGYPERLRRLTDAPAVLSIAGDPAVLQSRCIAMVGSRAATRTGLRTAAELAAGFARAGVVVVSGLARGIDGAAHAGALEAGGRTIAFQACGIDQVYPAGHRALARRIEATGARVTEFPIGTPPLRHHFPLRNRLISALCEALVVVEARPRSGTLVTAGHAADQGVDVFAVPGPVGVESHAGALQLLRDGATIVLDASDVLGALRPPVDAAPPPGDIGPGGTRQQAGGTRAPLSAEARRVWATLGEGPATRDELARRLDLVPGALALPLLELELAQRVEEERDGRLRAI